jgi:hypothetical protein
LGGRCEKDHFFIAIFLNVSNILASEITNSPALTYERALINFLDYFTSTESGERPYDRTEMGEKARFKILINQLVAVNPYSDLTKIVLNVDDRSEGVSDKQITQIINIAANEHEILQRKELDELKKQLDRNEISISDYKKK